MFLALEKDEGDSKEDSKPSDVFGLERDKRNKSGIED